MKHSGYIVQVIGDSTFSGLAMYGDRPIRTVGSTDFIRDRHGRVVVFLELDTAVEAYNTVRSDKQRVAIFSRHKAPLAATDKLTFWGN